MEERKKEEWRKIKCFSNYEISDTGSLKTFNWKNSGQERIMKPSVSDGYLRTTIVDDYGNYKTIRIHRLVCEAFHPNPEKKEEVNHKDGVKTNNHKNNLEWVTHTENCRHSIDTGLQIPFKGEEQGNAKLTDKAVRYIRDNFKPRVVTRQMLADKFGVAPSTIKDVVIRKSWKHIK